MRILTLLLCTLGLTVNAQVQPLTLKDALSYALENKSDAKKSRLEIENSENKIQEIRSRALPQIAINSSLTYNPILQTSIISGNAFGQPGAVIKAQLGQKWNSIAGISLNQPIFDLSVFTGLRAAKSTREFYQINNTLTEEQVIEKVANSYYAIYVQRERLTLLDSSYANTSKVRNVINGSYKSGLAKKIDLDRIEVKLANIDTERQQVKNQIELQENALKFFMGMPIEAKFSIPKNQYEITPEAFGEAPKSTERTEYLLLKKQEDLLMYNKKATQAALYPTLSFQAGYNYFGQGPEMPLFAKPSQGVYWTDFSSMSLNMRIPIFTGLGTRARIRQADVAIRSLQEDIKDTQLGLDLDYRNAKAQIENNIVTINAQKINMQLAQDILKNTKNNYTQGLASLTDLLDAENASLEAQTNYSRAVLAYKIAEVSLLKSKGQLRTLIK